MDAAGPTLQRLSCRHRDLGKVEAFWRDDLRARVVFDGPASGPGPFRFDSAALGGFSTGLLRPNIGYTVFDGPSETYIASVTTRGRTAHVQAGIRYDSAAGQALIYRPGLGPRVTRVGISSEVTYLRLAPWVLERHLERLLERPVARPVTLEPRAGLGSGAGHGWWNLLRMVNKQFLDTRPGGLDRRYIDPLCEALLSALLLAVDHQYREALSTPTRPARPRHVQRALDVIHAHPEQPYTVTALAALAGVGPRSLQQGFQLHLGTTPMTYLRQVRLARAHDDLAGDERVSVAQVAHRWGFTHLGRFAAAYAQRYGHPPSHARPGFDGARASGRHIT